VSSSTPNLFSCRLIAVVIAGREVLMVRKRHTGLWDLPGGDLRVGEHPETGIRRIVESDSSTVVAITGLVGIYNRSTPRLSLVFGATPIVGPIRPGPEVIECDLGRRRPGRPDPPGISRAVRHRCVPTRRLATSGGMPRDTRTHPLKQTVQAP